MNESGPPCKRCAERKLSCVLNKSLQTLIEERSQWKESVIGDLGHIHASLQEALTKLSLPPLPPLQTNSSHISEDTNEYRGADHEDEPPSYDHSPHPSPKEEGLPHAPIDSLYQITRLRTLRSDDSPDERKTSNATNHDFISKGLISIEDADRLVGLFVNRIDHFMYKIGSGTYRDLDSLRRGSSVLTACICTVAALHDPNSNHLYATCGREFRRLMSASMFDRRMDQDCMRAMCVASYWLHDLSWMLSGYAIRRAMEVNLSSSYQQVLRGSDEEAMNNVRIWYVLYICDRHLSILYGRPSIVRDDVSVNGWEEILRSPMCTESDRRLVSQMALLVIMGNARELFGPDTGEFIPIAFAPQFEKFSRQIDNWVGFWSSELLKLHENIGEFPTKGVILHHHLAKLHLHSHVFRGLKGAAVPQYFEHSAVAAVAAATAIIETVLTDDDIRDGLVGIPHYIHSMIAFACVFLLKIAAQYSGQYIDDTVVYELTTKAVQQFRSTPVGKWHLVHLMAEGLEKMLAKKTPAPTAGPTQLAQTNRVPPSSTHTPLTSTGPPSMTNGDNLFGDHLEDAFSFGTSSFLNFDTGTLDLDFTGLGF
ncbi:hypothetical protein BDU57DRAFT_453299 [Ampelomyces quisqualis]|uniref:Xylanolytic transcriptional activator regulatory domain-containing protein n=1 Tax=Ampelomyces quisqualis TaxID=50730 RepID=A0A6A5QFF0_AMPQU|nr:hypothetical protein BDU57DRAFT_453299 [Ampelomyces quisqualis]